MMGWHGLFTNLLPNLTSIASKIAEQLWILGSQVSTRRLGTCSTHA